MTYSEAIDIIYQALRHSDDPRINDVTTEQSLEGTKQLVLTTDDGVLCQTFVLDESNITETD